MSEMKIHVDGETKELIIRHGDALPVEPPKSYEFSGEIDCVVQYIEKRIVKSADLQQVYKENAIVTIARNSGKITLLTNPNDKYGTKITGTLRVNPDLLGWKINVPNYWNRDEFAKLIRFRRMFFANKDEHAELLRHVSNLKASTAGEIVASKDTRGNRANVFDKRVHTDLPQNFLLEMPLFKGFNNEKFLVDVCFEEFDGSIRFWLESVSLEEMLQQRRDSIIEYQAEQIANRGLLMMYSDD